MPTYTFHCDRCDASSELVLPMGSKNTPACPSCKGPTRKIIKPPMVHFKGSGFYKTDASKSSSVTGKPAKPAEATPAKAAVAAPSPTSPTPATPPPQQS